MLNAKFLHQIKSQSANNNRTHPVDDKRKYLMRCSMVFFIAHTFVTFICSTSSPIFSPSFLFSFSRSAFSSFQFFHPSNGNVTHNENEEGKKVFEEKNARKLLVLNNVGFFSFGCLRQVNAFMWKSSSVQ